MCNECGYEQAILDLFDEFEEEAKAISKDQFGLLETKFDIILRLLKQCSSDGRYYLAYNKRYQYIKQTFSDKGYIGFINSLVSMEEI